MLVMKDGASGHITRETFTASPEKLKDVIEFSLSKNDILKKRMEKSSVIPHNNRGDSNMDNRKDTLRIAEEAAKNLLGLSATTALAVLGLSEKEAASEMSISGAVNKALSTASTEAAVETIRAAEVLAFSDLRKAEETAVAVLATAEVEAVKVLAKASVKAVNVLAMAETMLAYARGQLEVSIVDAATMLNASQELSASELLLVEDFDAQHLSTTQTELLEHMENHHQLAHHMGGGYSMDTGADCTKKVNFEQAAQDLRETRRVKAFDLKQHQADTARDLVRFQKGNSPNS